MTHGALNYRKGLAPRFDIYKVFTIFLVCSFIGWVFEAAGVGISKHIFTTRGYLFVLKPLPDYFPALQNIPVLNNLPLILGLPLIEIYGFGGILAIVGFHKLYNRPVLLFFTGMVVLTLFELLGSYFCSYVLHKTFWDYSGRFLNFQGRICLMSALAWGIGSVAAVKWMSPAIDRLYKKVRPRRFFKGIVITLMLGALFCALCKYWWFKDVLGQQIS